MTMQRLINLTAFAEAAKVLTTCAENNNISGEDITHLRAIEPEFNVAVETLLQLFGATTSTTTTMPVESSTETSVETSMETIGESETAVPVPGYAPKFEEVWKSLPKLPHIQVSNLGHVKSEGKESTPRMVCGYMKFYDPVNRKYYILANAVLTAFVGERTASYSPYYRDGNKENCTLENLRGILSLTKDPAFVKKLYAERLEAHKTSSDDLVALVLAYMMLGMEDAATIQKAIHKDFGRKLMVSNSQLKAIIG